MDNDLISVVNIYDEIIKRLEKAGIPNVKILKKIPKTIAKIAKNPKVKEYYEGYVDRYTLRLVFPFLLH